MAEVSLMLTMKYVSWELLALVAGDEAYEDGIFWYQIEQYGWPYAAKQNTWMATDLLRGYPY